MKKDQECIEPQYLSDDAWYYVEPKAVIVVHEVRVDGRFIRTDQFKIPIKRIEALLAMQAKDGRG